MLDHRQPYSVFGLWHLNSSDLYSLDPKVAKNSPSIINQSMFISQATNQRIFQARKAFEQGHCLQVISQAKASGCMMAHGCLSTRSAEPGKNLIWRERTEGADNTWCRPCQGGVDSGRMRGRFFSWRRRRHSPWSNRSRSRRYSQQRIKIDQADWIRRRSSPRI